MRYCVLVLLLFKLSVTFSQDSIKKDHYKVRLSCLLKYTSTTFKFSNSTGYYYEYKTNSRSEYAAFEGTIKPVPILTPEIKLDFELPIWLKVTCGIIYNRLKFVTPNMDRIGSSKQYIYDSTALYTPDPTPIGSYNTQTKMGYNKNRYEIQSIRTYLGLGISKKYRRFTFDVDYFFCANKIISAVMFSEYYDLNHTLQNTQVYNIMTDYIEPRSVPLFTHNFTTSVSYRIYKRTSLKLGYAYSKNDTNYNDNSPGTGSAYQRVKCHSLIIWISGKCY